MSAQCADFADYVADVSRAHMQGIRQGIEGLPRQLSSTIILLLGLSGCDARRTHAQGIDEDVKDYVIRRCFKFRTQPVLPGRAPGALRAHPPLNRHGDLKSPPSWHGCYTTTVSIVCSGQPPINRICPAWLHSASAWSIAIRPALSAIRSRCSELL